MEVVTEGKERCVHLHIQHRQGRLHDERGRGGGRGQRLWGEVTGRRKRRRRAESRTRALCWSGQSVEVSGAGVPGRCRGKRVRRR